MGGRAHLRQFGGKAGSMDVRNLLRKYNCNRNDAPVLVVGKDGKETKLTKFEVLCPAMVKDDIGNEEVSSFTIKGGALKIYTRRRNG